MYTPFCTFYSFLLSFVEEFRFLLSVEARWGVIFYLVERDSIKHVIGSEINRSAHPPCINTPPPASSDGC